MARRRWLSFVIVSIAAGLPALILAVSCSTPPNESDVADAQLCTQLRDHLVELRASETAGIDIAAHRRALAQAMGDAFVSACTTSLTVKQVKCALSCDSLATATECSAERFSIAKENH